MINLCVNMQIDDTANEYRITYFPEDPDSNLGPINEYLDRIPSKLSKPVLNTVSYGEMFIFLANIDLYDLGYAITKNLMDFGDNIGKDKFIKTYQNLEKILLTEFGMYSPLRELLLMQILNTMNSILQDAENDEKYMGQLLDEIRECYDYNFFFCNSLSSDKIKGNISVAGDIELACNLRLNVDGKMVLTYRINDLDKLMGIDHFKIISNNIKIKKCENCGKFFIPYGRSDEIYCNNIFDTKRHKTCKELGYELKSQKDPFKSIYRTAYKTQHARYKRNSHILNYKEKYFDPWVTSAKEALLSFQSQNDINGFKEWIEQNKDIYK